MKTTVVLRIAILACLATAYAEDSTKIASDADKLEPKEPPANSDEEEEEEQVDEPESLFETDSVESATHTTDNTAGSNGTINGFESAQNTTERATYSVEKNVTIPISKNNETITEEISETNGNNIGSESVQNATMKSITIVNRKVTIPRDENTDEYSESNGNVNGSVQNTIEQTINSVEKHVTIPISKNNETTTEKNSESYGNVNGTESVQNATMKSITIVNWKVTIPWDEKTDEYSESSENTAGTGSAQNSTAYSTKLPDKKETIPTSNTTETFEDENSCTAFESLFEIEYCQHLEENDRLAKIKLDEKNRTKFKNDTDHTANLQSTTIANKVEPKEFTEEESTSNVTSSNTTSPHVETDQTENAQSTTIAFATEAPLITMEDSKVSVTTRSIPDVIDKTESSQSTTVTSVTRSTEANSKVNVTTSSIPDATDNTETPPTTSVASEEDPEPEEETDTGNVVNEPELTTVVVQRETSPVTINYGEDPQVVVKKEGVKETVTVEIDGIKYVMVTEKKDGSGTKKAIAYEEEDHSRRKRDTTSDQATKVERKARRPGKVYDLVVKDSSGVREITTIILDENAHRKSGAKKAFIQSYDAMSGTDYYEYAYRGSY